MTIYKHMMNDTVTKAPKTGVDENGDPKFGSQTEIQARVFEDYDIVRAEEGDIQDTKDTIITHADVNKDDRFWLPNDDTSKDSDAKRAKAVRQMDGVGYNATVYEVVLH